MQILGGQLKINSAPGKATRMTIAPKIFAQINPPAAKKHNYQHLFSDRELEVLQLLGQGKNNREIATALHLTEGTVKNHITNILGQLGMRDRTQAALWTQQNLHKRT